MAELPCGKGKQWRNDAPGWVNGFIGGWQVSMLTKFRSGLALTISTGGSTVQLLEFFAGDSPAGRRLGK